MYEEHTISTHVLFSAYTAYKRIFNLLTGAYGIAVINTCY